VVSTRPTGPRGAVRRRALVGAGLLAAPGVARAQEAAELRIGLQFGFTYLPLIVMCERRLIEAAAARQGIAAPRPLAAEDLPRLAEDYAAAAERARGAGAGAVEIHAAHGSLLDQFLRSSTKLRGDGHGGTPEGRARLLAEVAGAVATRIGAGRVGVRLSPRNRSDAWDDDPLATFAAAARALAPLGLGWLHAAEPRDGATPGLAPALRAAFGGRLILAGGLDCESGERGLLPTRRTRWRSDAPSSPTPICRRGRCSARRSPSRTPRPSRLAVRAATSAHRDG
jgi:hypothetical protein